MTVRDLPPEFRERARVFREHEQASVAIAYERCADELERTLGADEETSLTLTEAAEASGYSADHLGRLVRSSKIPNAGRKGSPRIARQHLPRKSAAVATVTAIHEIDRTQIVRRAIRKGVA